MWFNLAKQLELKKWSLRTFAKRMGIKPQYVTRYFKKGFDPNASTVLLWCQALNCSVNDLLDENLSAFDKEMPLPMSAVNAIANSSKKDKKEPNPVEKAKEKLAKPKKKDKAITEADMAVISQLNRTASEVRQ